jgi:hypothetical protein
MLSSHKTPECRPRSTAHGNRYSMITDYRSMTADYRRVAASSGVRLGGSLALPIPLRGKFDVFPGYFLLPRLTDRPPQ